MTVASGPAKDQGRRGRGSAGGGEPSGISDGGGGGAKGKKGDRKTDQAPELDKTSSQAFKKWAAEKINDGRGKTPQERCELIASFVKAHHERGAPKTAVWEAISAVMFRCRLQSHGGHRFDLRGRIGGKDVSPDAKHSKTSAGYHEKSETKARKVEDSLANPDVIPAYFVAAEGHGIYLHVGFDSDQHPTFKTEKGNPGGRGLVRPRDLGARVDGSGTNLPFVELTGHFRSLRDMAKMGPDDLRKIELRAAAAFRGIDMAKMKKHVAKQAEKVTDEAFAIYARINPEGAARAAAARAPEATAQAAAAQAPEVTARAGLEAMGYSPEQIDAMLTKVKKRK